MTHRPTRTPAVRPAPLEPLEPRTLLSVAVTTPLPAVAAKLGAAAATVDLSADFSGADVPANTVFFDTSMGLIPVELTPGTTPLTVANFLSYVTAGSYDNSLVHRSVDTTGLDIWQGGSFTAAAAANGTLTSSPIIAGSAVPNEYGDAHPNVRGTIAMAKVDGDPNSATDGWFFNVADNSSNLDSQNGGFTTFGTVIGNGLAVMDAISAVPTYALGNPFNDIPLVNYTAGSPLDYDNAVTVATVRQVAAYTVTSDDPAVVTAAVDGDALTYAPVAAGTARLTVTATGLDGSSAIETFAVTVVDPTIGLLPAVTKSTVPANLVVGNPTTGSVALTLTNTTATPNQGINTVQIFAVPVGSTDTATGMLLATVKPRTNLAPGAKQKLTVPIRTMPATSGAFTLLARTTNVAGTVVTAAAGPTVTVSAPSVSLSVAVAAPKPSAVVPGHPVTYTLTLANDGNVDATGKLTATVGLTLDGIHVTVAAATVTRSLRIKAGGKPLVLRLKAKLPTTAAPGTYQLLATISQQSTAAAGLGTAPLTVGVA